MKFNASRALAVAAGLVIIALTGAAFWLSYAHLAEVAHARSVACPCPCAGATSARWA